MTKRAKVVDVTDIETRPYVYTVPAAIAAFGFSESKIRALIREDKVAVRYDGSKVFIVGTSLRRYIDSLPSVRVDGRECAARRSA